MSLIPAYDLAQKGMAIIQSKYMHLDGDELFSQYAQICNDLQYNRLKEARLFPHQKRLWEGKTNPSEFTMLQGVISCNRGGKTFQTCLLLACHLTGDYSALENVYTDIRYKRGVKVICAGASEAQIKEAFQLQLLGTTDRRQHLSLGTGLIPRDALIIDSIVSSNSPDGVKSFRVKHSSGTESQVIFVSYEQSRQVLQGSAADLVFFDEQPSDDTIVSEIVRSLAQTPSGQEGRCYCSFTPLLGRPPDSLVDRFMSGAPQHSYVRYTWDDLPDELLPKNTREALSATFMPWERDARIYGIPSQGQGAVFQVDINTCLYDPAVMPIRPEWKLIWGVDFGRSPDPCVLTLVAWERDTNMMYVIDSEYRFNQTVLEWHSYILARQRQIPVAWPSDGRKKGYTETQSAIEEMRSYGVNCLSDPFSNPDGNGNSIDYGIGYMLQRMRYGTLKINKHLSKLIAELSGYHTERNKTTGKIAFRGNDHGIDSARYALLSVERFGRSALDLTGDTDSQLRYRDNQRYIEHFHTNPY